VAGEGRRDVPEDSQDEAGALTPLHPDQVKVLAIRAGLLAALLTLAAFAADLGPLRRTPLPPWLLPLAVLALGGLATLTLPRRRYRHWGYREGEDELEIRRGMLVRVRTIVPFGRVQHIDVAQGPVQRRFGLATLILHTAGTQSAAVPLPGLLHAEAEEMRDRIRAKIRQEFA
jgi:membrane protein YdbS with pleckstrin-like domain